LSPIRTSSSWSSTMSRSSGLQRATTICTVLLPMSMAARTGSDDDCSCMGGSYKELPVYVCSRVARSLPHDTAALTPTRYGICDWLECCYHYSTFRRDRSIFQMNFSEDASQAIC